MSKVESELAATPVAPKEVDSLELNPEGRAFLRETMAETAVRSLNAILILIDEGHVTLTNNQHYPTFVRVILEGSTAIKLHDKLKFLDVAKEKH
jgi:hypothetical protein